MLIFLKEVICLALIKIKDKDCDNLFHWLENLIISGLQDVRKQKGEQKAISLLLKVHYVVLTEASCTSFLFFMEYMECLLEELSTMSVEQLEIITRLQHLQARSALMRAFIVQKAMSYATIVTSHKLLCALGHNQNSS